MQIIFQQSECVVWTPRDHDSKSHSNLKKKLINLYNYKYYLSHMILIFPHISL